MSDSDEYVGIPGEFSTPPPEAKAGAAAAPTPMEQFEEAKRRHDVFGEVEAVRAAQRAMESAPWYPAQAGDMVHVNYTAAHGETYVVEHSSAEGGLVLVLRSVFADEPALLDADAPALDAGRFAPGMVGAPLMQVWFEVGPAALMIVREGRVVHAGTR